MKRRSNYSKLVGLSVFAPFAEMTVRGTIIETNVSPVDNEPYLVVTWQSDYYDDKLGNVFSIHDDIGKKIYFRQREAIIKALSCN